MEWNEDFESGLADMDVQHRYIFALIQRVHQLDDATDRETLKEVAVEIARLAICHFGCEEKLMSAYEYPEANRHTQEHEKLLDVVREFQRANEYSAHHLALFLCNWLVSHTMLEDRRLAHHVLTFRAKAMGMSIEELVGGVTLNRPSAVYAKAKTVKRDKAIGD
jgi:hemerythrin-like metal-binding protein